MKSPRQVLDDIELKNSKKLIEAIADGIEFYKSMKLVSVAPTLHFYEDGRVKKHKILYKVRFKDGRRPQGKRKSVTVIPTETNCLVSVVSNIAGESVHFCGRVLANCKEPVVSKERFREVSDGVKRMAESYASSDYGRQEIKKLLEYAASKSIKEIKDALREALKDALANGIEQDDVFRMMHILTIEDVHKR